MEGNTKSIQLVQGARLLISIGVIALFIAVFGGNRVIALGHGLLIIAAILCGVCHFISADSCPSAVNSVRIRKSLWALGFLIFAMILSVVVNWDNYSHPWRDLKKIRYELLMLMMCVLPFFRVHIRNSLLTQKLSFWLCISVATLVTLAGIYGVKTGGHPFVTKTSDPGRVGGISGTVMTYAYSMQFLFLLLLSVFFTTPQVKRYFLLFAPNSRFFWSALLVALTIFAIGIYMSMSRGALLGVGAGGLALLMIQKQKWPWIPALLVVAVLGIYTYTNSARIFRPVKAETVRLSQWKTAALTFAYHPFFGVGHRQFEKQSATLKKQFGMQKDHPRRNAYFKGHAHNNYLEAFASTGILGGLSFLAFCLFWLHEMLRSTNGKIFFTPVIVAFLVSGFFENTFTDSEVLNTIMLIYFVSQLVLDWEHETAAT